MRFYKIETQSGGFFSEKRDTPSLPSWTSDEEGRLIYNTTTHQLLVGNDQLNLFARIFDEGHSLIPDTSAYDIGDAGHYYLNVYGNDFYSQAGGAYHGDLQVVDGDISGTLTMHGSSVFSVQKMIGNIWESSGVTMIFENGGPSLTAWYIGDVRSKNGATCLANGATPAAATFTGTAAVATIANSAKYA